VFSILCFVVQTHARPQLDSFDSFFEQFGSAKFSQPASQPSAEPSSRQLTSSPSQTQNAELGKAFPTAVPYVHDPRGDGPVAHQQEAGRAQGKGQVTPDPKTHQAALARNALHRQQLAEVIEKHNREITRKQEEIVRASAEETEEEIQTPSKEAVVIARKNKPKSSKHFNLEKFLKKDPIEEKSDSEKEYLGDIKEDVLENIDLILQLAEEIAELDVQAFDVFSKKKFRNRKKNFNSKKTIRKEVSSEETELEDDEYHEQSDNTRKQVKPTGRIRNIGLKIRQ